MSDARLREAERRWREGGRLEDRLRWWSERARAGELPADAPALIEAVAAGRLRLDRLELAAYLGEARAQALALDGVLARVGDEAVRRVVEDDAGATLEDVLAWIGALRAWGPESTLLGALVAGTRHVGQRHLEQDLPRVEGEDTGVLIDRERAHQRGVHAFFTLFPRLEEALRVRGRDPDPHRFRAFEVTLGIPVHDATVFAARAVLDRDLDEALRGWRDAVAAARPDPWALRAAVRDEVAPRVLEGA